MKLYAILNTDGQLLRYEGTQADAKNAAKVAEGDFEQVEVPTAKAELIDHLNQLIADRGEREDEFTTVVERHDPPVGAGPSSSDVSIAIDDAWEGLPLARKLHFAALACEDARDKADVLSAGIVQAEEPADDDADDDDALFS